jgi:twitching motility protein PilJ/methyl-accepting chemotaxis protein PixJ
MAIYSAPHQWQSSEINFLKQLAAQFGLSLERVTLLQDTEQLADEQRQLKEGSTTASFGTLEGSRPN